jgi:hypothetical protein
VEEPEASPLRLLALFLHLPDWLWQTVVQQLINHVDATNVKLPNECWRIPALF